MAVESEATITLFPSAEAISESVKSFLYASSENPPHTSAYRLALKLYRIKTTMGR
jgi:hypothetical protein